MWRGQQPGRQAGRQTERYGRERQIRCAFTGVMDGTLSVSVGCVDCRQTSTTRVKVCHDKK